MSRNRIKVVINDDRYSSYTEEKELFDKAGFETVIVRSSAPEALNPHLEDMDALLVNLTPLSAELIQTMDKCRCISRYGVGYDNVDIGGLQSSGIVLANVPDYCTEEVTDQALGFLLDGMRRISQRDRKIRKEQWNLTDECPARRMKDSVLGIIGYGKTGSLLHHKVSGFNLSRILVYSPSLSSRQAEEAGVEKVSLEQLCSESDMISIHCSLNKETQHLLGREQFNVMKPGVVLVNTSRGAVINTDDLIESLKKGHVGYAGLDVFEKEPLPSSSELRSLENITLTDHAGWFSTASIKELKQKAARNIVDFFEKGEPTYPVPLK